MKYLHRFVTLGLMTWVCASLLTGCATTRINSQWKDPGYTGRVLKGDRVLVLCLAPDDTLRHVCEDQWADQLSVQGISAVRGYSLPGLLQDGGASPDKIRAEAQASGAGTVASMKLELSAFVVANPGPQVGVGVGSGSGGYGGGGFSFGSIGFSFPVGGTTLTQGMNSSTTLVDVARGVMVWSSNASTPSDTNTTIQASALTKATIESMKEAGLIE